MDQRTRIVAAVMKGMKLPPRFRLRLVKEDPVRLELSVTPAYGKDPIIVGLVESLDLVARRDREGRIPRDLQALGTGPCAMAKSAPVAGTRISKKPFKPCLKQAFQRLCSRNSPERSITLWTAPATFANAPNESTARWTNEFACVKACESQQTGAHAEA